MSQTANQVAAALTAAVSETMEGMAFETMEPSDEASANEGESQECQWVSLEIVSPYRGQIIIELPCAYAEILARAMYGDLDDIIPPDVINDTLAELSNTLAGRFMLELLGPDRDYALGFPVTGNGECPIQEDGAKTLFFTGSGYTLSATITGNDFSPVACRSKELISEAV